MCGYNVYQVRWTAVIGEAPTCNRELGNASDPFAVVVIKGSEIVGNVAQFYLYICNLLLHYGGSLSCCITENRWYSSDLPQGGLELPCSYKFTGFRELIEKLKDHLKMNQLDVGEADFVITTYKHQNYRRRNPVPCLCRSP